jgi:hypothetical protein
VAFGDAALDFAFGVTERLGTPLAVAAWVSVFAGAVAMGLVLRGRPVRWGPALVVGGLALAAHLLDYFVTLYITPGLQLEANPLWRSAIRAFGLPVAKVYALSGKVLLSVLSAQLWAWYQVTPAPAVVQRVSFKRIARLFAASFALFGPYFFYITLYNWLGFVESPWYERLPSPPLAIALYFAGVIAVIRVR